MKRTQSVRDFMNFLFADRDSLTFSWRCPDRTVQLNVSAGTYVQEVRRNKQKACVLPKI